MNLEVRFILGLLNVPDHIQADIEKSFPGAEELIEDFKLLEPLVDQVAPIWKRAYPNFVALLPVAEEILQFIEAKKQSSVS